MSQIYEKQGGAAFPLETKFSTDFGMSLRDYFAGQALSGSLASQTLESHWAFSQLPDEANDDTAKKGIAKLCYDIADAMLKARKDKP